MLVERLLKVDTNIESALTHHLFNLPPGTPSLDLISFNIQRGRDHGLPSYTEWRRFCGSPAVTSFEDLKADFDQDVINRLQQVYTDVHDIDVFVGSIAERLLDDALVGPLNVCLLARQFRELKLGDRFWYENGGFISSFTKDQLKSIRAMTMSRVMCDTLETIDSIQPFAFRESDEAIGDGDTTSFSSYSKLHTYPNMQRELPGFANVRVSCQDGTAIPHLDLTAWKD
ncbi:ovoperoxidase [Apostichopus japonicus]|uniref:Ovoperoxidase n=1 Tax=Stichopus japonicus TaxID=307972 RepID=A0A2G8K9D0_STIJA|nr:ovoperoxidase [Apostichopus japonicus]